MEGPEFYHTTTSPFCPQLIGAEKRHYSDNNTPAGDHFVVEEFLNFSNDDDAAAAAPVGFEGDSSTTVTAVDSCCNSSSFSGCGDPNFVADANNFSGDLCVPYDDLAELEWLSNIVEESFSSEDLQRLQLISGIKARSSAEESAAAAAAAPVPAKARSKRSRAQPCNWTSRLLLLSSSSSNHNGNFSPETTTSDDSSSDAVVSVRTHPPPQQHHQPPPPPHPTVAGGKKPGKSGTKKKEKEVAVTVTATATAEGGPAGVEGRRCLHCATDKTPQWRTGPMGPKTLCNACGVRYKSGRLVPEYRPAASPTFMLTRHSNSHRKVLELRRQKDFMRAHQQQQHQQFIHHHHNGGMVFDNHAPPQQSTIGEDYLIHHHQHVGPDYRQII